MRWIEITGENIKEQATAGVTGSGNIATLPGGRGAIGKGAIGAGFDPNGHKGIYDAAERRKKSKKSK